MKVFMFPWLAHGHISPFLELAKTLSKRNFSVYLCSTKVNLGSITDKYAASIQLVELQVPALPGLPANFHTTKNLPPHLMPTLKKAFDRSSLNFSKLLKTVKPDLLIYDTIQPWAPVIAAKHNIPAAVFVSTSATMTSLMLHRHKNPNSDFPFPEIHLHGHEIAKFNHLMHSAENYYKGKHRFSECLKRSSGVILVKSSSEIEGKYMDHLSILAEKKIIPVGPLVQPAVNDGENQKLIEWLDEKDPGSTVFVSFGSEYFPTQEELEEVAHGLELSGANFIWVVRFPAGQKISVDSALPDGFLERVSRRGFIVPGWAPQVKILEHPSIGGFVSHCGWSSVMEGIKNGVPIIAVPMHLDQPVNARLVAEIGGGVEVRRGENGKIVREEVGRVIKQVVMEKTGKTVRKRERNLSERMEEEFMDRVADELRQLCREWKKTKQNGVA
ncbi:beta-D-glucosyl crocetin beta-1,6-glucosyltransferase [Sarracenia purpurea var. burkii]